MPDNTRPRYINPPTGWNNPMVNENSALGLPPFGTQVDPYAGLQEILSNLNPMIAAPPQASKFQRIMDLIANAAAVGTAQDPSAALAAQLKQKRDEQLFQYQQQLNRNNKIEDLKIQLAGQKAQDISREQSKQAEFQRESDFRRQERVDTQNFNANEERERERRQLNIDSIKRDWKIEDVGREARLQKKIEAEFLNQDIARLTAFENVKNVDERRAARDQKMIYYMMAGISADVAKDLADSYISGKELTPSQSKLLNRATDFYAKKENLKFKTAIEESQAQAYHYRKSGDAAVVRAGLEKAQQDKLDKVFNEATARQFADLQNEEFVHMKDGTLRKYDGIYKEMRTLPPGADRMATDEERRNYVGDLYKAYLKDADARKTAQGQVSPTLPQAAGSPIPTPSAIPTPNAQPGQPPTELENKRMEVATAIKQSGITDPNQINALLDQSIKEDPANAQIYEGFKIRTAQNPTAQPSVTPSPTVSSVPGTSVDDYTKKRREQIKRQSLFGGGVGSQIRKVSPEEKAILDEVEKNRKIFEKAKEEFYKRNAGSRP